MDLSRDSWEYWTPGADADPTKLIRLKQKYHTTSGPKTCRLLFPSDTLNVLPSMDSTSPVPPMASSLPIR